MTCITTPNCTVHIVNFQICIQFQFQFKNNKTDIDRFQDCCKAWAFTAL